MCAARVCDYEDMSHFGGGHNFMSVKVMQFQLMETQHTSLVSALATNLL